MLDKNIDMCKNILKNGPVCIEDLSLVENHKYFLYSNKVVIVDCTLSTVTTVTKEYSDSIKYVYSNLISSLNLVDILKLSKVNEIASVCDRRCSV